MERYEERFEFLMPGDFPKALVNKAAHVFRHEPETYSKFTHFLATLDKKKRKPFVKSLMAVLNDDHMFKVTAEKFLENDVRQIPDDSGDSDNAYDDDDDE
ncbi:hypothetical protein MAR_014831 [Mya arenaria]|uniref:Uncharacterized protein n=1 Tax=Mya arenaria TaxID=6604 RepID=A0ABY7FFE3_MYAAR|nr:hypothetical protein MAR_014831 [Mya arenaria]